MQKGITHTSTYHFIQRLEDGKEITVGHSTDDETGEIYFKFINKKQAVALMDTEKEISPECQFRLITVKETFKTTAWLRS